MSKKKKKKSGTSKIFRDLDAYVDIQYDNAIQEIEDLQLRLRLADEKAKKKSKKRLKKGKTSIYENDPYRIKEREKIVKEMEGSSLLDKVINLLNDICPIVMVLARLVATLITGILNVGAIQTRMSPEFLLKMKGVYNTAMAIAA